MIATDSARFFGGIVTDSTAQPASILVLCRDLLFASKITATAKAVNVPVKLLRDPAKLTEETAGRLIVDLTQAGYIEAASQWRQRTGGRVTGFAGHADGDTLAAAQAAGIDQILTRGEFSANLPAILGE